MSEHNGDHQSSEPAAEALTALALNQLSGTERSAAEAQVAGGGEAAQQEIREIRSLAAALTAARTADPLPQTSAELRQTLETRLAPVELPPRRRTGTRIAIAFVATSLATVVCALFVSAYWNGQPRMQAGSNLRQIGIALHNDHDSQAAAPEPNKNGHSLDLKWKFDGDAARSDGFDGNDKPKGDLLATVGELTAPTTSPSAGQARRPATLGSGGGSTTVPANQPNDISSKFQAVGGAPVTGDVAKPHTNDSVVVAQGELRKEQDNFQSLQLAVTPRIIVQESQDAIVGADPNGTVMKRNPVVVEREGQTGETLRVTTKRTTNPDQLRASLGSVLRAAKSKEEKEELEKQAAELAVRVALVEAELSPRSQVWLTDGKQIFVTGGEEKLLAELAKNGRREELALVEAYLKQVGREAPSGEQYDRIIENAFLSPRQQPLSTFSVDVDTASYANVRRFLMGGQLPPANAVRIEELVNYFKYDYPQPKAGEPFSVNMEVAECPWQTGHLLLRVGLKGKEVPKAERPPSNLVFLLDVSGSMQDENKLPLLKTAMQMLVGELGEDDRVSIVTYAGEAGLRLSPTRGHERQKLNAAIESLSAGGSTNGSAGINLAYDQAAAYFVKGGTNRVILCTDGDLNVGVTSDDALTELIKQKAAGGTFLTVLGFGEGNLKDAKLEKLADNGNGLYAYIDGVREARKVLVEQLTGSTITIAKDVKLQIEFNPQEVAAYRLLGYENRVLAAADFANDKKDAGEIGAGHTVTAIYELVPAGEPRPVPVEGEPLKYQRVQGSGFGVQGGRNASDSRLPTPDSQLTEAAKSGEFLTLKLRYKEPEASESKLLEYPLKERGGSFNAASRDMQFASAVASFGMILRGSEHRGSGNLSAVIEIATGALGEDRGGYRAEFVDLVRKAQGLGAK